jgi:K+-transporting ATPase ATPase C chain
MMQDGRAVGSSLIGQPFDDPALFWSRPSAIGTPYDASTSSGSNLGPSHPALAEAVAARVRRLRMLDPGARGLVPVDLVTASASGLDPHISPAAARYQIRRIARLRRLPPGELDELVRRHTEPRTFGFLGEPRVNVGALNHAVLARERPATRGARMVP